MFFRGILLCIYIVLLYISTFFKLGHRVFIKKRKLEEKKGGEKNKKKKKQPKKSYEWKKKQWSGVSTFCILRDSNFLYALAKLEENENEKKRQSTYENMREQVKDREKCKLSYEKSELKKRKKKINKNKK